MKKEQVLGLVRHLLTLGGGYAIGNGLIDDASATQIIGAVTTVIGLVWSWYSPDKKIGNGY